MRPVELMRSTDIAIYLRKQSNTLVNRYDRSRIFRFSISTTYRRSCGSQFSHKVAALRPATIKERILNGCYH